MSLSNSVYIIQCTSICIYITSLHPSLPKVHYTTFPYNVNVGKCGIVHFRKRRVKRCEEEFRVNGERIGILTEYKYLGCVISEHLDGKGLAKEVQSNGRIGKKMSLSLNCGGHWLSRCSCMVLRCGGVEGMLLWWSKYSCRQRGSFWGWVDYTQRQHSSSR